MFYVSNVVLGEKKNEKQISTENTIKQKHYKLSVCFYECFPKVC